MERYKIGCFVFEPDSNVVRNTECDESQVIKLDYKHSRILHLLAENQGQIISREKFSQEIWEKTYVSDASINNKICALRRVLGDDPRKPVYIKTHPQLGYELLAPVDKIGNSAELSKIREQTEDLMRMLNCSGLHLI